MILATRNGVLLGKAEGETQEIFRNRFLMNRQAVLTMLMPFIVIDVFTVTPFVGEVVTRKDDHYPIIRIDLVTLIRYWDDTLTMVRDIPITPFHIFEQVLCNVPIVV